MMILTKMGGITKYQTPSTKKISNLKNQSIGIIFIVRGAGCKPEWRITPKIGLLIFTPHLLIPLPQGARKVGERESFSSFAGAGWKPEWRIASGRLRSSK
jgi:hypothetical protein